MRSSIKPFVLPAAIASGLLFHEAIKFIAPLSPYLIFMMLLLTFSSIDLHKIRFTRLQLWLLLIQISVCWIPYVLLRGYSSDVAAGLFMCVFISTATAAPVVTKMLGGSVEMLVSYSLTSNLAFALLAPPFLSIISDTADVSVAATLLYIARGVLPLLLVPLLVAYLLGRYAPELRSRISRYSSLSFYLWEATGLKYPELLDEIIRLALKREREEGKINYSFDTNILSGVSFGGAKGKA